MKRFLAALLCIAMLCTVFCACSSLSGEEKGAVISVYMSEFPDTLDPALVQLNADNSLIMSLLFESLTTVDSKGNVVGALAKNWYGKYDPRDEEYKMYFELKETAWSDTITVQAQHIVDAWARILDPATESPYASLLFPIKNAKNVKAGIMTRDDLGVAAEDDYLLCVTFEEEFDCDLFAEIVSDIHLCPQREDIIARAQKEGTDWGANATDMACNGPYRLQALDEGNKLVLERNSYYMRDPEEDALDKTVIPYRISCIYQEKQLEDVRVSSDERMNQLQYQTERWNDGNIYFTSALDKDLYSANAKNITSASLLSSVGIYFNCAELQDANVRKGLSAAIDRTDIVNNVLGTGETVAEGIVPARVFNNGKDTSFRQVGGSLYSASADTAKAKELLGGKKGSITLTYLIPESSKLISDNGKKCLYNDNVYEKVASAVKANWEAVGYSVELKGLNPAEYRTALYNRDYQALIVNVSGDSTDAFTYLAPFAKHYSGAAVSIDYEKDAFSLHYTNYDSEEYEKLIDDALASGKDRAARAELLHKAEAMLAEDCPVAMIYGCTYSYMKKSDLSGLTSNYFGFTNFTRANLNNWRKINAAEEEAAAAAEK